MDVTRGSGEGFGSTAPAWDMRFGGAPFSCSSTLDAHEFGPDNVCATMRGSLSVPMNSKSWTILVACFGSLKLGRMRIVERNNMDFVSKAADRDNIGRMRIREREINAKIWGCLDGPSLPLAVSSRASAHFCSHFFPHVGVSVIVVLT